MDIQLEKIINGITVEKIMALEEDNRIKKAVNIISTVQQNINSLYAKKDELDLTQIKIGTILLLSVLTKLLAGKSPKDFKIEDWKDIAGTISDYAICMEDENYSVFIFRLYEQYIRVSASQLSFIQSKEKIAEISALADELIDKAEQFQSGHISEVNYIEDSLWVCLEAMIKLLSGYLGTGKFPELIQAASIFAFEYGRYTLYKRQLESLDSFLDNQRMLDIELQEKYDSYLNQIMFEAKEFEKLISNAFAPNFRSAFLASIILAQKSGVDSNSILNSSADIDAFFL